MSFRQRVASVATITLAVTFGFAGFGSPGLAQEASLAPHSAAISIQSVPQNAPAMTPVPAIATDQSAKPLAAQENSDADENYASLEEAVADQDLSKADDEELKCLATAVYFESKGEPLAGQLAVATTILNRTKSGRFPKSACGVVRQPGQFSFVRGGTLPAVAPSHQYRTAMAVAKVAMGEDWDSPAPNALFFHASWVAGAHGAAAKRIGNQVFYR